MPHELGVHIARFHLVLCQGQGAHPHVPGLGGRALLYGRAPWFSSTLPRAAIAFSVAISFSSSLAHLHTSLKMPQHGRVALHLRRGSFITGA